MQIPEVIITVKSHNLYLAGYACESLEPGLNWRHSLQSEKLL